MRPGSRVLSALLSTRWAITEEKLRLLIEIAHRAHQGEQLSQEIRAIEKMEGRPVRDESSVTVRNGIATVPLVGPMFRYANLFTRVSGATSTELFIRDALDALTNPQVRALIVAINSPGGEVDGVQEAAQLLFEGRSVKPIIAHIDGDGASGAYWMASATSRIVTGRTSLLGSIGVRATFFDESEAERKAGIQRIEIISSQSPKKGIDPTTAEGRAQIQAILDDLASVFVADVARNRGVAEGTVLRDYGRGGVFVGQKAVDQGLADAVATYEELHTQLEAQVGSRPVFSVGVAKDVPNPETIVHETIRGLAGPEDEEEEDPDEEEQPDQEEEEDEEGEGQDPPSDPQAISERAATAERERLAALDALMRPGAEAIIAKAKADPSVTPQQAAQEIVLAENAKRGNRLRSLAADVQADPPPPAAPAGELEAGSGLKGLLATVHRMNQERATTRRTTR